MIHIEKTICQVCGKVRNQHVNHSACAKARQQQWAHTNFQRALRRKERQIARG